MGTYDLVIVGGRLVTDGRTLEAQICINEGKIASIDKSPTNHQARTINSKGLLIFPGFIDCHVHFRDPGLTQKEDFESGSRGAAAGGVTTIFDMPNTKPVVTNEEILNKKIEAVKQKSLVDFGLIAAAGPGNLRDIPMLASAGAMAFKTYTVRPIPEGLEKKDEALSRWCATEPRELKSVMEQVKKTGLLHCIHAENDSSICSLYEKIHNEGRKDSMAHYDSRPSYTEVEAVSSALKLAEETGVRLHIVHMSASQSMVLLRQAKIRGVDATAETCPQYLYFTKDILKQKGPFGKYNPPSRESGDRSSMLAGLASGVIDLTATDHAPHTLGEKATGWEDIFRAPSGTPGVETRIPLLLNLAWKGVLDLHTIQHSGSESVAQRFSLFPKKGSIAVGSDADLAIVDCKEEWRIDGSKLQTKAWESVIYDGIAVRGRVKYTLLRGELIYEDGVGFAEQGYGKLLKGAAAKNASSQVAGEALSP